MIIQKFCWQIFFDFLRKKHNYGFVEKIDSWIKTVNQIYQM